MNAIAASSWRRQLATVFARLPKRPHLTVARLATRPLPDRWYLALGHLAYFKRWPNYTTPRTINEHIQAYMLRSRDPLLKIAGDKMRTREWIARMLGEAYLVPLLGVWDDARAVPLETLPRPCVLKATAGSGMVRILGARTSAEELRAARADIARWLRRDYSRFHREWCYEGLPRRVMAEIMLRDEHGDVPADYKAYVIGGRLRFIQVDRGRFGHHTRNLYSPQWSLLPVRLTIDNHALDPPPPRLAEMIRIAETLAEPFEFMRTDFYVVGDQLYVGELTNYPGAGFEKFIPHAFALELGQMWRTRSTPSRGDDTAASAECARQ